MWFLSFMPEQFWSPLVAWCSNLLRNLHNSTKAMKFLLFVNGLWRCGKMDPFDQGARISNGPFLLLNLVSKLCPMFYSCNLNIQIGVAKWGGALWCVTNLQCPAGCQEDWNILLREQMSTKGKSRLKTLIATHKQCFAMYKTVP